jgi:hypothetical protein
MWLAHSVGRGKTKIDAELGIAGGFFWVPNLSKMKSGFHESMMGNRRCHGADVGVFRFVLFCVSGSGI